jgi:Cdc6-like AAA superfamily ATPase
MSVMLNSLPTLPFEEKHRDLQLRRMPELGQWLLNMPKFKLWREGSLPKSTLWCHGAPGAGKTFLT